MAWVFLCIGDWGSVPPYNCDERAYTEHFPLIHPDHSNKGWSLMLMVEVYDNVPVASTNTDEATCRQTFADSPSYQLLVLLTFFALHIHELSQSSIIVDDANQFFHLCIVLLHVLLRSVFQCRHLVLRLDSAAQVRTTTSLMIIIIT